jgi:hypothetical protein
VLLQRKAKGSPKLHLDRLADNNWSALKARLLDGQLVRQQIVDGAKLQAALRRQTTDVTSTELLDAYSLEVWLSGIQSLKQQTRAARM